MNQSIPFSIQSTFFKLKLIACFVAVVGGLTSPLLAQIQPNEVVVLAAENVPQSKELAEYYAVQRKIPAENICLLPFENEDLLTFADWESKVRPQFLAWLAAHPQSSQLRVVTTIRGVPLRIDQAGPEKNDAIRKFFLEERVARVKKLVQLLKTLENVGLPAEEPGAEKPDAEGTELMDESLALTFYQKEFERVAGVAQTRLQNSNDAGKAKAINEFEQLVMVLAGSNLMLSNLQRQLTTNPSLDEKQKANVNMLRGRAGMLQESVTLASQFPPSKQFDTLIMALLERSVGMIGTIAWIEEQLKTIDQNLTGAAFDSELAICRWNESHRRESRWEPNFLRSTYANLAMVADYPTFIVGRLDAPTWETARALVDRAVSAEQNSVTGNVYFDARGLDLNQANPVEAEFERDLLTAGSFYQRQSGLTTIIDNKATLFESAPNAVLYCGGYSLGKYADVFDWAPGAIGYHLSTIEAQDLHADNSTSWCGSMLNDGITVTIGAVDECGLGALPRPQEFFRLLSEKKLSVGEAYWQANPFTSWNVILLGDPMFRPFK